MNESAMSGNFLEPPSSKGLKSFQLRKRKRKIVDFWNGSSSDSPLNSSVISKNGMLAADTSTMSDTIPEVKRKRSLSRMTSVISTPMAKMSSALQRSFSTAKLAAQPSPQKLTPTRFLRSTLSVSQIGGDDVSLSGSPALKRGTTSRSSSSKLTPYRPPQPTPTKQRPTRYWSDKYAESARNISSQEIKLQEAVFELACGEDDLVKDLKMIQKNYGEPLLHLNILNSAEVDLVFGKLRHLIPLHTDLYSLLDNLRCPTTGISAPIGMIVFKWVEQLHHPYVEYCSSLIRTKAFIDHRKEVDRHFNDFLQRCLESGFSRKLDLWSYLDVPRSKLVKYPLLIRQVIKFSSSLWPSTEVQYLHLAVDRLEMILQKVDTSMAEAKCQFTISRLEWLDEAVEVKCTAVRKAREELLDGILRNNRGTKLECHLLDTVLLLGRPSSRLSSLATVPSTSSLMSSNSSTSSLMSTTSVASYGHQAQNGMTNSQDEQIDFGIRFGKRLQVYRTPIPVEEMVLEDLNPAQQQSSSFSDHSMVSNNTLQGNGVKHGSFKSAFSGASNTGSRNAFKVSFRQPTDGQAHTLFAPDEHSKRQWMAAIRKAMVKNQQAYLQVPSANEMPTTTLVSTLTIPMNSASIVANAICETDFSESCSSIESSSKNKRVYAIDGKIAKNQLTPVKTGLFQKHKRSPRIKTALSQTALECVKSGGAAKKIRSTSSARRLQDENFLTVPSLNSGLTNRVVLSHSLEGNSRLRRRHSNTSEAHLVESTIKSDSKDADMLTVENASTALRRQPASSGSLAAAAVGKRIMKQQLKTQTSGKELKRGAAFRSRTRSWGHLNGTGNASYHGEVYSADGRLRRYNTRSASKKISKSMSDLLEV